MNIKQKIHCKIYVTTPTPGGSQYLKIMLNFTVIETIEITVSKTELDLTGEVIIQGDPSI